jgi:hypothetical protein
LPAPLSTGDNKTTAEAICRKIGVLEEGADAEGRSFTGREFVGEKRRLPAQPPFAGGPEAMRALLCAALQNSGGAGGGAAPVLPSALMVTLSVGGLAGPKPRNTDSPLAGCPTRLHTPLTAPSLSPSPQPRPCPPEMPRERQLAVLGAGESLVFSRAEPRHKQVRTQRRHPAARTTSPQSHAGLQACRCKHHI